MLISILLILIAKVIIVLNAIYLCPKQMNKHSIFELKKLTKIVGDYHTLHKINIFPKFIVSFTIEVNETLLALENFSIIITKLPIETEKFQNKQNLYAIKFYYSKEKKFNKIIKINKRFQENELCSNTEESKIIYNKNYDEIKKIGKMSYAFIYTNNELIMYSENEIIYKEIIDLKKMFGEYASISLKSKNSIKSPIINFKDFIICDSSQELNNIRNLEENENIKLEIDEIYIESSPNYLRSGNVYMIPLVFIIVKDGNGNLIPDLRDKSIYNKNFLNSLVNVTHSKNSKFIKRITIDKDNNLVIFLDSKSSGQFYLTSNYFNNIDKYIININNLEIYEENTEAEIYGDNEGTAGNIFKLKILLKDKYGSRIDEIEDSDKEKFEAKIILPDNSTINCNKILFNNKENILVFENLITLAGESTFEVKYNNKNVKCNNCKVKVNPKEMNLDNIIVNHINNESKSELNENNSTTINKDNNLMFEALFYDEYNNKINNKTDYKINTKIKGLESEIELCQDKKESSIVIFLCDNKDNKKNWHYLVNGEYFLEVEYENKSKNYSLRIDGQYENGSNGKINVNNTYISTNEIKIIAGEYKNFSVELRTNDGKRKNYWYEEPYSEIEVYFVNNEICTSNITTGDEPGQYYIIIMCTKKIGENQIILKIEGEEVQKKINLSVIPYDVNFFSSNDTLIENNIMPSGTADNPYIIKFKLVDINNRTIDCPDKFSYQFSNSNTTFTDYDCNSNQTIYINNSFTIMGEYSFIIPIMNKTYSFSINHGEPTIVIKYINCTEKINTGEKASITLSLDVRDNYNNLVPKEEIINNLNIILESKDINYTLFSLEIEENNDVLLKYSTKSDIQIADSYLWIIFYNGKIISNDNITKVIAVPYYPNTKFALEYTLIDNGTTIECSDFDLLDIEIYLFDQSNNILNANEYKMEEAYIYKNDNNREKFNCKNVNKNYFCQLDCSLFNGDSFLIVKFKSNDNSGNFIFNLKKE